MIDIRPRPRAFGAGIRNFCQGCFDSDALRPVRLGNAVVMSVHADPVDRCLMCGFPLKDDESPPAQKSRGAVSPS